VVCVSLDAHKNRARDDMRSELEEHDRALFSLQAALAILVAAGMRGPRHFAEEKAFIPSKDFVKVGPGKFSQAP
jgi:hypothetical protein